MRSFLKYWLPLLLWLGLIFGASSDRMSVQHSSRIIGPLMRWLFPRLPEKNVEQVVFGVRKCAHVTEYAILSWLLFRALNQPKERGPAPWNWPKAAVVFALVALYAASDEIHQLFVPSRQASVWDVLLDSGGAAVGLLVVWSIRRWRGKLRSR